MILQDLAKTFYKGREFPVGPGFFSFFFVLTREFPVGHGFFFFFFCS